MPAMIGSAMPARKASPNRSLHNASLLMAEIASEWSVR